MEDREPLEDCSQASNARRRLLILEDEDSILMAMAKYFSDAGWEVVAAREPEEADAVLQHSDFDAVIIDLGLTPFGREGLVVLGSLRARHPHLPVVILSGYLSPEAEAEARRLEADAILQKPYPLPGLAQVLDGLIGPT